MIQIDMPMPDNCLECRFNTSEFGYCNAMPVEFVGQVSDFEEDGRPEWCPLKALEARVMTLGDLREIGSVWELNTPPYLWMEINPSYRWTRGFWVAWREIYDMIDGLHPTYDADNYGEIWRCWTSRPDEKRRAETPWES